MKTARQSASIAATVVVAVVLIGCFEPRSPDGPACDGPADCSPGEACVAGTCMPSPDDHCDPGAACHGSDDGEPALLDHGSCLAGQTRTCGTDTGECRAGVETCATDGTWSGVCVGTQGPVAETCNGRDDDCDGLADNAAACMAACVPIPTITVDRLGPPVTGDWELGHGAEVWLTTTYQTNGAQICADVHMRLRETTPDYSEASRTVRRCVQAPATIASVISTGSTLGYIDTDTDYDVLAVPPGTGIGQIRCIGVPARGRICNEAMPECPGCEVSDICVRVQYQ